MPPRRRHRPGGALRSIAPESRGSAPRGSAPRGSAPRGSGSRGPGLAPASGPRGSRTGGPIVRVLIDGRNVQHALARDRGSALPTAALVARIRAAFSPPTEVELILDGHAAGSPQGRVAPGLSVVFTRGATADQVIGERVTEAFRALGAADAWSVVVVTDDREVRDHARRNGVRVEGTAWLGDRLTGGAAAGIGNPRPPRAPRSSASAPREPSG